LLELVDLASSKKFGIGATKTVLESLSEVVPVFFRL
jgi:hypothetical protein